MRKKNVMTFHLSNRFLIKAAKSWFHLCSCNSVFYFHKIAGLVRHRFRKYKCWRRRSHNILTFIFQYGVKLQKHLILHFPMFFINRKTNGSPYCKQVVSTVRSTENQHTNLQFFSSLFWFSAPYDRLLMAPTYNYFFWQTSSVNPSVCWWKKSSIEQMWQFFPKLLDHTEV